MRNANRYAEQVQESIDAFNRGDVSGYAAHYAEDARYIGRSSRSPWSAETASSRPLRQ